MAYNGRVGETYVSDAIFISARYPRGIWESVIQSLLYSVVGVRAQNLAERLQYVGEREAETCPPITLEIRNALTPEAPSTICDDCGHAVHAVIENGMSVFPIYASTRNPGYQLCESCYERAEQAGRAKVVTA